MPTRDFAVSRTSPLRKFRQAEELSKFALDVRQGLSQTQKEIPSQYLYDQVGTALFEAITYVPEYGLTRADERLLRRHAGAIVDHLPSPVAVAELGSGTGRKTRWILEALAKRQPVTYFPIDIAPTALAKCRQELAELAGVSIVGLEHSYVDGLRDVVSRRRDGQTLLVLFLGSTIGNFEPHAADRFLTDIRRCLLPGDALLLGTDLEKALSVVVPAYDDAAGVTAAFNLNVLARINRELHADFVLKNFRHEARYRARERRVEMHLRSTTRQTVRVRDADFTCSLQEGETIWTEACHKFRREEIPAMATRSGFACTWQWVDADWPFAENLLIAMSHPN